MPQIADGAEQTGQTRDTGPGIFNISAIAVVKGDGRIAFLKTDILSAESRVFGEGIVNAQYVADTKDGILEKLDLIEGLCGLHAQPDLIDRPRQYRGIDQAA